MLDGRDKVIIDHQCDHQFPGCEIFSFLQEKFSGWPPLFNKRRFFCLNFQNTSARRVLCLPESTF